MTCVFIFNLSFIFSKMMSTESKSEALILHEVLRSLNWINQLFRSSHQM